MSASTVTSVPAGTWNVDPSHSVVQFSVKHMGIATVKGQFNEFQGSLVIGEDGTASATGTVEIETRPMTDEFADRANFHDVVHMNDAGPFADVIVPRLCDLWHRADPTRECS